MLQGSGLSGLFGSKENSRTVSNFLRSDESIERDSSFQANENAVEAFVEEALTAHLPTRNPMSTIPSLRFSGMFSRGGSFDPGKKAE